MSISPLASFINIRNGLILKTEKIQKEINEMNILLKTPEIINNEDCAKYAHIIFTYKNEYDYISNQDKTDKGEKSN